MPRNFEFPRARGGRGPQIGPGTFDGRSASDGVRPEILSAVVWSPGPDIPSIELWCMHTSFATINPGTVSPHSVFLDKVPEIAAFSPPLGEQPGSLTTVDALKQYARSRRYDEFPVVTATTEWTVHVARPGLVGGGASQRRIPDGVYRVTQFDRPVGSIPLAWVWVSSFGARQVWLYHRPNEADGFYFVGTLPAGQQVPYTSTETRYIEIDPRDPPWDGPDFEVIARFKDTAKRDVNSPVLDVNDLVVHDLRVEEFS